MTDSQLTTGWICIATEGTTLDGRKIESQWLLDMAETYDVRTYTALIWEEHKRDRDNLGEVLALRSDKQSGIVHLYARIRPTAKLMSYNELGQKLFCSIEVEEDFQDKGHFYLSGLAVTDSPASIGTDRLRFSANRSYFSKRGVKAKISKPREFSLSNAIIMAGKGWVSAIALS